MSNNLSNSYSLPYQQPLSPFQKVPSQGLEKDKLVLETALCNSPRTERCWLWRLLSASVTVTTSRCDVNSDKTVDIIDLVLVGKYLGASPPASNRADVNGDGTVDIQDLLLVSKHFGE